MTVRVLLVDDHDLLRAGLATVLGVDPDILVAGEAANGRDAVRLARELRPDVVLMDIEMPGGDGIAATADIVTSAEGTRVLVLTTFDVDDYVLEALRAGASGFLLKTTPPRELIHAVKVCAAGETPLGPTVVDRLVERYVSGAAPVREPRLAELTDREEQVLRVMAQGLSNAEIGAQLPGRDHRQDLRRAHPAQARRPRPGAGGRRRTPQRDRALRRPAVSGAADVRRPSRQTCG